MAGRNRFDDAAFRALFKDSLQDIEVSEQLRARTLEACRQALAADTEAGTAAGTDAGGTTAESGQTLLSPALSPARETTSEGRVLAFLGRHRAMLRTAAGLAACLLVAVLVMEFLPRMGSRQAATLAMSDRAGIAQESVAAAASGASMEMAPEAADAQAGPGSGQAKMAVAENGSKPEETVTNGVVAESPAAASAYGGTDGSAADAGANRSVPAPAPDVSGDAAEETGFAVAFTESVASDAAVTMQYSVSMKTWMPYGGGLWVTPLSPRPDDAAAAGVARTHEQAHPDERVVPAQRFAVLHAAQGLSAEGLAVADSLEALQAEGPDTAGRTGPIGLWMMPVDMPDGKGLLPLFVNEGSVGTADAVRIANRDGWFGTLRDEATLRAALEAACGTTVDAWTIVDVDAGTGFWVGWTANGKAWVMPLMDRAAELGLENGRGYAWDALVATVVPFL